MAREARAQQADVLLLGLRDPASPLSLVDTAVVKLIMEMRSAPIRAVTEDGCAEVRDPDTYELQSFGGQPAVESRRGEYKAWYRDGLLHRGGDEPAVERGDGLRAWYRDGKRHRDGDEPAMVLANGDKIWYRYGNQFYTPRGLPEFLGAPIKPNRGRCMDCAKARATWRCSCYCREPTLCGRCVQKRRHALDSTKGRCPGCNYPSGSRFSHI